MISRHSIRRHLPRLLALMLILSLVLVACERPLQDDNSPAAEEVTEQDLEQGGGAPADAGDEEPTGTPGTESEGAVETEEGEEAAESTDAEPTEESEAAEAAETTAEESATEEPETEEEAESPRPEDEAAAEDEEEASEEEASEEASEEEVSEEEVSEEEVSEEEAAEEEVSEEEEASEMEEADVPGTHVVQPGENLYRIGLQYGISWVALAQANNITNPNRILVGQTLTIPSASDDGDTPTPTPEPGEETTYVVQPGDNLYRIGRRFNMSWVEIAEANGIINPNRILVGQELTIAAGPPAEITHTVQPGESLFEIALQYGVTWTTIATTNNINPPYVIYPGQVLTIPGG